MKIKQTLFSAIFAIAFPIDAQTTFEENGIVYLEDISNPSQMQVYVLQKKSPLLYPGQSAYSGEIVIPAQIEHDLDTYNVVGLGRLAFMNCNITSLDIEAPITEIAENVIYSTTLKRLKLPDSLISLRGIIAPNIEDVFFGEGWSDLANFRELFFFTEEGQKRNIHCPWKSVPIKPDFSKLKDQKAFLNIYVPKGMKQEYIDKWELEGSEFVSVFEE